MGLSADFNVAILPVYIICSVGFLANLMLLIAIIKDPLKCFRNSATYLVTNLAISDLLFNSAFLLKRFQNFNNMFIVFLQVLSFYLSLGTIFSISLDRFLIITFPFKHRVLMSANKMAIWIGLIWFSSLVPTILNIFAPDKSDKVKAAIGSILILLSSLLYGRAYFVLREQARSMADKKTASSLGQISAKSYPVENNCTCADKDGRICEGGGRNLSSAVLKFGNSQRNDLKNERVRSQYSQCQKCAAEKHVYDVMNDHVQNDVCEGSRFQDEYAQNRDKQEKNQDEPARDHDKRCKHQNKRVSDGVKIVLNMGKQSQNITNSFSQQRELFNYPNGTIDNISQNGSAHNPSTKYPKTVKVIKTANEQKYLNTIILITFIAIVTVYSSTIWFQVYEWHRTVRPGNLKTPILISVFTVIFCLNFAVNPFIYCWRLKNYRESLKKVYCCKY